MNLYLQFFALAQQDKKLVSNLNPYMHHLLCNIALYNSIEELPMRCANLLIRKDLGSPATIHKNYRSLLKLGYLKHSYSKSDARLRYIELTEKSHTLFRRLEALLKKSVR